MIENDQGTSPAYFNMFFPDEAVLKLLNHEHVAEQQDHTTEMEALQSEYLSKHTLDVNKDGLKKLAATYVQSDKVETIISSPLGH